MESHSTTALTRPMVVCLLALVCCLLWGSAFPCIKIGYGLFQITGDDRASQILFAGLRFTLAGLLAILFGSLLNRRLLIPQRSSWGPILKLCLFQTVIQYLFFYMGLAGTTGVKASIITATNVFWAILITCVVFRQERLTAPKILGCILGFAGVIAVNVSGGGLSGGFTPTGDGFIMISAISYAVSSALIGIYSKKDNPVTLSGYQFVLGGLILTLIGVVLGGHLTPTAPGAYGMLLYLGFVSAVAYSLWSLLLKYNPVSTVAVYGFMNPIAGVVLSAILLGEQSQASGPVVIVALALVCLGIFVVNRPGSLRNH